MAPPLKYRTPPGSSRATRRHLPLVLLLILLAPGLGRASLVDYKNREINVKVVAFGPDMAACAATLDSLLAHAGQKTKPVTTTLRAGVTLRHFSMVPRGPGGEKYRYRRFAVRLWIYAVRGPATAEELDLLFRGADAVVFVSPVPADEAAVGEARQEMNARLRRFKRLNAPVVIHRHKIPPAAPRPGRPP